MTEKQVPDRNLAMELVRVTEAAALAAVPLDGPGRQGGRRRRRRRRHAHRARHRARWTASSSSARARRTRRRCSTTASASATAPRRETDIAVDPIDGTTLTALGRGNAIAVIAVSERGTMFDPGPVRLHGEDRRRPRGRRRHRHHRHAHREPRRPWPRPRARRSATSPPSSSTAPATTTSSPRSARPAPASASSPTATSPAPSPPPGPTSGADILFGIGGTPEGVITAAALKCMGGEIQGRLWPRNDEERAGRHRRRLRPRPGAHHRRPRRRRQLLLRRHRHHRRRAAQGRPLRPPAAPPPSRWSCARSPAPSASSTPATALQKLQRVLRRRLRLTRREVRRPPAGGQRRRAQGRDGEACGRSSAAGFEGVATYIASGNLFFDAPRSREPSSRSGWTAVVDRRVRLSRCRSSCGRSPSWRRCGRRSVRPAPRSDPTSGSWSHFLADRPPKLDVPPTSPKGDVEVVALDDAGGLRRHAPAGRPVTRRDVAGEAPRPDPGHRPLLAHDRQDPGGGPEPRRDASGAAEALTGRRPPCAAATGA